MRDEGKGTRHKARACQPQVGKPAEGRAQGTRDEGKGEKARACLPTVGKPAEGRAQVVKLREIS